MHIMEICTKELKRGCDPMTASIINYYGGGNTARGFVNYYDSILQDVKDIYVIKNAPQVIKTSVIKSIAQAYLARAYEVEIINSYMGDEYVEGVIVPSCGVAFIDGNPIYGTKLESINKDRQYIDLSQVMDEELLRKRHKNIEALKNSIKEEIRKAHVAFGEALKLHDLWEKVYIDNMDFDRANDFARELINRILGEKYLYKKSKVMDRFLGVATPEGPRDFIPSITRNVDKRYLIKGRPGTGKSTILGKLLSEAKDRGFDIEAYHCGFDPDSYDMIVIRELNVAVFDSTKPHEYLAERHNDEIIDTYEELVYPETDKKFKNTIESIREEYTKKIKEATGYLSQGKKYMLELESLYLQSINKEKLRNLEKGLGTLIEMFVK